MLVADADVCYRMLVADVDVCSRMLLADAVFGVSRFWCIYSFWCIPQVALSHLPPDASFGPTAPRKGCGTQMATWKQESSIIHAHVHTHNIHTHTHTHTQKSLSETLKEFFFDKNIFLSRIIYILRHMKRYYSKARYMARQPDHFLARSQERV